MAHWSFFKRVYYAALPFFLSDILMTIQLAVLNNFWRDVKSSVDTNVSFPLTWANCAAQINEGPLELHIATGMWCSNAVKRHYYFIHNIVSCHTNTSLSCVPRHREDKTPYLQSHINVIWLIIKFCAISIIVHFRINIELVPVTRSNDFECSWEHRE